MNWAANLPEALTEARSRMLFDVLQPRSEIVPVGQDKIAFCFGDVLSLWDIVEAKEIWRYTRPLKPDHERSANGRWHLTSDQSGRFLYSVIIESRDRSPYTDYESMRGVTIFDTQTGEQIANLRPDSKQHRLIGLQISSDGSMLMAPQISYLPYEKIDSVVLFDSKSNRKITTIPLNRALRLIYWKPSRILLNSKGTTVSVVHDEGWEEIFEVDIYEIATGRLINKVSLPCLSSKEDSTECIDIAFDPAGRFVATSHKAYGGSDFLALRDPQTWVELRRWNVGAVQEINWFSTSFDTDGGKLSFANSDRQDGPTYVINTRSGDVLFGIPCNQCVFARNGSRIVGYSNDSVLICDANDGRVLGKILRPVVPRYTLLISPEQRFAASGDLASSIISRASSAKESLDDLTPKSISDYFDIHNKPHQVYADLNGVQAAKVLNLPHSYRIPTISINEVTAQGGRMKIQFNARSSGDGIGVKELSVRIAENRDEQDSFKFTVPENGQVSVDQTIELPIPAGVETATIVATVRDQVGGEGIPVRLQVKNAAANSSTLGNRLFVLSIGVSQHAIKDFNLAYAASDAIEVANSLRRLEGVGFGSVVSQTITDDKATLTNIRKAFQWLLTSCGQNDSALIFISGHGVRGRRGLYYLPHEGDPESIQSSCLNWEELAVLLTELKSNSILCFTDVCHAGAIGDTSLEMQQQAAEALRKNKRAIIGASSQGNQFSLELESLKHGAFAVALCESFAGKADANEDGALTFLELEEYCTSRVVGLTDGKQKPKFMYGSETVGKTMLTKLAKGERKVVVLKATPIMRGSEQIASVEPGKSFVVERQENGWSLGTIELNGKNVKGWVRSADLQSK